MIYFYKQLGSYKSRIMEKYPIIFLNDDSEDLNNNSIKKSFLGHDLFLFETW